MGGPPILGPFVAEDSFVRHVDRRRRIKPNGTVSYKVFKDKHETLSFTCQNAVLRTEDGLDRYQRDKQFESGDLPGFCRLTLHDLTVKLEPPLPPRPDPVPEDEKYGHLHCCTDRPTDDDQREVMAHLATLNGIVRPFVPKEKRKDSPGKAPASSDAR